MKKIVFLDRDGVINKKPPMSDYVKKWEEFRFLPGAIEAIKLLNDNGFKVVVVTNQAGIAKGQFSLSDLHYIHDNMQKELKKHNAHIDAIYFCPHGYDDNCDCRKPKPGLLLQAAKELKFDTKDAILIGDDEKDEKAGEAAGCETIRIKTDSSLLNVVRKIVNT